MKYFFSPYWLACILLLLITPGVLHTDAVIIAGKLVEEGTGKPVNGAYICIVSGEEETISGRDGSFILKTWQRLPVQCTIEHKDFTEKKLIMEKGIHEMVVLLKPQ